MMTSSCAFEEGNRMLGPPDLDHESTPQTSSSSSPRTVVVQTSQCSNQSHELSQLPKGTSTSSSETTFNPAIFGRVLLSPDSSTTSQNALVVHNKNPFLQLASVPVAVALNSKNSGISFQLSSAPVSGPQDIEKTRRVANFPTSITAQTIEALNTPVAFFRPLPTVPVFYPPQLPKVKSLRPKFLGKSKAQIGLEAKFEAEAAVTKRQMEECHRERCEEVQVWNEKSRERDRPRQLAVDSVSSFVKDVLDDLRGSRLAKRRDLARDLGDILLLDENYHKPRSPHFPNGLLLDDHKVSEVIKDFIERGSSLIPVNDASGPTRAYILDFACELYWRKEVFTSRQLLLGLILHFAGRNISRCSELVQSIYTRVVPLICHVIMVQPAYLLPPNAENDVSSIATRLANFGNMLTEWEHAVDAIIQNCGHHRLDSCLKRCMHDPNHKEHAQFQLAMCTAFAPIVVKDPSLQANFMLGSVSYFTYAFSAFGTGAWSENPWCQVLTLEYLYENILEASIKVLEEIAELHSFEGHSVQMENVFLVLSNDQFRRFATRNSRLRDRVYTVVETVEMSKDPTCGTHRVWFILLKLLELVDKEKLDLVMEMWLSKGQSLETRLPDPTEGSIVTGLWNLLSRQFRTSTPENDTNTVSKPNGNTKQFSHPLFCWAVATIVETSNHVDGEIFQGYLQQHNAIPRLYDFWLANKEQELQSVYSAALERCCGTRYAFDELVKVNFDGMIEAGLRNTLENLVPNTESIESEFWIWSNPQFFAWQLNNNRESLWGLANTVCQSSSRHRDRYRGIVRETKESLKPLRPPEMAGFMLKVLHHLFCRYSAFADLCTL